MGCILCCHLIDLLVPLRLFCLLAEVHHTTYVCIPVYKYSSTSGGLFPQPDSLSIARIKRSQRTNAMKMELYIHDGRTMRFWWKERSLLLSHYDALSYTPCCALSTNRRNTTECRVKNLLRNCWTELNIWMLTGLIEIQIRPSYVQALFCSQALDYHGQLMPHVQRRCRRKPIPSDCQGVIERACV